MGPVEQLHGCEHWLWLSGVDKSRAIRPELYSELCNAALPATDVVDQIDLDVGRTHVGTDDTPGDLDVEQRRDALRRVLLAFARHDPETGYVQGMGDIAARALLTSQEVDIKAEEAAFWWLKHVNEAVLEGFFARGMAAVLVEMRTVTLALHAIAPKLASHLEALDCDLACLSPSWYLTLFQRILPMAECGPALSILAARKLEPTHIALGILLSCEDSLLTATSFEDVARVLCGAIGGANRRVPSGVLAAAANAATQLSADGLSHLRTAEQEAYAAAEKERMARRPAKRRRSGGRAIETSA
jgi:hypothetical protein